MLIAQFFCITVSVRIDLVWVTWLRQTYLSMVKTCRFSYFYCNLLQPPKMPTIWIEIVRHVRRNSSDYIRWKLHLMSLVLLREHAWLYFLSFVKICLFIGRIGFINNDISFEYGRMIFPAYAVVLAYPLFVFMFNKPRD